MKFTFYFALIMFTIVSCKSNMQKKPTELNYIPYYLKAYEADSLFLTNNFEKSYKLLDSLFKVYKPVNTFNINEYGVYIASAVMSNHTEGIDDKIRYGILNCGGIVFFHPDIDTIQTRIYLKASKMPVEEYKKMHAEYKAKNVPEELANLMIKMCDEDQDAREPVLNEKLALEYEKKHKKIIKYILKKYGYPNYNKCAYIQNKEGIPAMISVVILHQSKKTKKGYLKFLYTNLKRGVVSPFEYSGIVDKIYMETDESLYGSFPNHKILYPKKLDSLRKSIGLPKYGFEKWQDNILHPQFYTKDSIDFIK